MAMRLYDTARQAVVPFEPGPIVTMYTCGITPYDATHLGHADVYVAYDVLQRRLRDLGHDTRCVRNITDVDDPLLAQGQRARRALPRPRRRRDGALRRRHGGARRAAVLQRAAGDVGHPRHPRLHRHGARPRPRLPGRRRGLLRRRARSRRSARSATTPTSEMLELRRERGGNVDDPNKRDPLDFVLWQPSADDEPSWESLWGPGRPGWHIECSALALRELGTTIDLHGGGADLIFPHHECERAQTEAATGEPFVRHWMHVADGAHGRREDVEVARQPRVRRPSCCKEWDPRAIRLADARAPLPRPWEWDDDLMPRAAARLERWLAAPAAQRRRRASTRCGPRSTTTSTRRGASPRSTPPSTRGEGVLRPRRSWASISSQRRALTGAWEPEAASNIARLRWLTKRLARRLGRGSDEHGAGKLQDRASERSARSGQRLLGHRGRGASTGSRAEGRRSCARTTSRSSTRRS